MIESFLLLGAIILAGFFGRALFEKTKIPDALLLLLLGLLLGPLSGAVDATPFIGWAPFIGTLALVIVLLEGGFKLNLSEVAARLPEAGLFALLALALSAAASAGVLYYVFGWPLLFALFAGVIFGGYASNIILPMMGRLSANDEAKMVLSLESVINDVFCIVAAIIILGFVGGGALDAGESVKDLAAAFTTAMVVGGAFGFFWMGVLKDFHGKSLGYIVTLAAVFIMYALTEALGGNGAIAVLVFGLVIGNAEKIASRLGWQGDYSIGEPIREVQTEIAFFVNTFFFVYLGLIFDLAAFNSASALVAGGILAAAYASRWLAVRLLAAMRPGLKGQERLLLWLTPRGLAAAVLAFLPANSGVEIPGLVQIVFLVILASNIIAGIATYAFEKKAGEEKRNAKPKPSQKPRIIAKN